MNKTDIFEFDPTLLSREECAWLLEHIDQPTVVALGSIRAVRLPAAGMNKNNVIYPDGVNPNAVKPLLEKFTELDALQEHSGQPWIGREGVKALIRTWLAVDAKWESDHRRTRGRAPRFPSLYSFDAKGRPHLSGPGSDSGRIKTYFAPDGSRKPIAAPLIPEEVVEWSPGFTEKPEVGLTVNDAARRIECFCGHTEQYKEGSRQSYNAARGRMSKHLRRATEEVEKHREIHTNEFGGAS